MIELGQKVKDTITGLTGVAVARCTYLNGCDHIGIQPPAKDEKIPNLQWVDEPQVEVVETEKVKTKKKPRNYGGPAPHPPSRDEENE